MCEGGVFAEHYGNTVMQQSQCKFLYLTVVYLKITTEMPLISTSPAIQYFWESLGCPIPRLLKSLSRNETAIEAWSWPALTCTCVDYYDIVLFGQESVWGNCSTGYFCYCKHSRTRGGNKPKLHEWINATLILLLIDLAILNTPHLACINFSVFNSRMTSIHYWNLLITSIYCSNNDSDCQIAKFGMHN